MVETWCTGTPAWFNTIRNYSVVNLDGIPAIGRGRDKRGICLFVKKGVRLSGITIERVDFGEYVSMTVNDSF